MNALIINCSPVKIGATQEIVNVVSKKLKSKYEVKSVCIDDQFKAFIDRCTPWCNTHKPYAKISPNKKGYVIALRTGPSMRECNKIIETINHFFGHLEIECTDSLGLCGIEYK